LDHPGPAANDTNPAMSHRARMLATLAAIAVVYFLAGRLGLHFARVNASVTAIWPAAGIAVAALLVVGVRAWPAVAIGAFFTNLVTPTAIGPSLAIAAGNTLEYVAAAALTMRFARGRFAFERGADILRFTALAALVAPTVAATIGTATLWAAGLLKDEARMVWFTWWLGDATGILLCAPGAPKPSLSVRASLPSCGSSSARRPWRSAIPRSPC
jgi:integral membrane sensor domain MASE1